MLINPTMVLCLTINNSEKHFVCKYLNIVDPLHANNLGQNINKGNLTFKYLINHLNYVSCYYYYLCIFLLLLAYMILHIAWEELRFVVVLYSHCCQPFVGVILHTFGK